jgi:diaminohydroxyphosphoribosylaminopyrimidine deaminase/5-amino-6-(5-phosphoribosylamino)uracil reductase
MQRCLQLANLGKQWVAPNPMVGSVIVYNGEIIGEGYHTHFGGPHAEVNAINSVKDKSLLKGATIYVSLEPCAHFGKTPPCTNLIIEYQLATVVIACLDPNPLVAGKGLNQLKAAGIEVITGVLEKEATDLNKKFIHFYVQKKPFIILKWAQTADGICGRLPGSIFSKKITNWFADILVHQLRSSSQAILVGYNTALYDNPYLTTRHWFGKNIIRIVIDLNNQLPSHLNMFTDGFPTYIFTLNPKQNTATLSYFQIKNKEHLVDEILEALHRKNIQSLIVEGGPKTLQLFIDTHNWQEAHIFTSNIKWQNGIHAPKLTNAVETNSTKVLNNSYSINKPESKL